MNRPTELTMALVPHIWDEEGNGVEEIDDLKGIVMNWIDSEADNATDDPTALFLKGIAGYGLASVDWRTVETELEKHIKERAKK